MASVAQAGIAVTNTALQIVEYLLVVEDPDSPPPFTSCAG